MDAAMEQERGLLSQILPPRLEDAGLEDCALPPDSIREAFFKAAIAVKSRATSFLSSDDGDRIDSHCVEDPSWPTIAEPTAPCATAKGARIPEFGRDEVVVGGGAIEGEDGGDTMVIGGNEVDGVEACVDGWQGLEIGEETERKKNGGYEEDDDEDQEAERPVLIEGFA